MKCLFDIEQQSEPAVDMIYVQLGNEWRVSLVAIQTDDNESYAQANDQDQDQALILSHQQRSILRRTEMLQH